MTDAEKLLQMMEMLSDEAKQKQREDFDRMAQMTRMIYDSYIKAGFSPKMAFELTKTITETSISAGLKK